MPSLVERDRGIIWHPYTQHGLGIDPLPVQSAKGAFLRLENGQQLIDAISSWWTTLHGHGHPELARAIARQAEELEHVMFAGFTHEPAVQLAEILVDAMKARKVPLSRVFYSDNGSTAVECALKIAYQFHLNRGDRSRSRFLALRDAYHGDTLGAMAASGPSPFNSVFRKLLPEVDFTEPGNMPALHELLERHGHEYAAVIVEPLIQGAAGMKTYPPAFLRELVQACQSRGLLFICDEVFTGFYRTGTCFAFEQAGVQPDLVCLSKGLSGGVLPLAATLCSEEIFEAFKGSELSRAFLHGHSFTANPIACAAAVCSWELLHRADCQASLAMIAAETVRGLQELEGTPGVESIRCLGTIGAVELRTPEKGYASPVGPRIFRMAASRGVLLRPLGNVVYAVPPYCVSRDEMKTIYETLHGIVNEMGENI